jgi:thioredoxin reductase (NADPH)
MPDPFDCVIVGAGPAGLTAALYLGRFKRRVLVLHDEDPRAAWIPRTHNLPGWPGGIGGTDLLGLMTLQAERYGAVLRRARVDGLARVDGGFMLSTDGDAAATARRVLIATGVRDNEPPLPGVERAVARGLIRICPICDGYEAADQAIGVIGDGIKGAREALFLKTYSSSVTLIHTGPAHALSRRNRRGLASAGIEVVETPIEAVEIERDRVTALTWGGALRRFDTVYSALGVEPRNELALSLGARRARDGRLKVNEHQETSVRGLYAAGDLVKGLNQLTVAMAEAAVAAVDIHNALRAEDGQSG